MSRVRPACALNRPEPLDVRNGLAGRGKREDAAFPRRRNPAGRSGARRHRPRAGTVVVASILGEERRKDVQARLASGDYDPLVWGDWLTEGKLDDSTRSLIGRSHPSFMGGEYLPALGEDEIEISRIVLASVTQDVISVRARRAGRRIRYSVRDESDSKFELSKKSSLEPLTLGELISLIDRSKQEGDTMTNGVVYSVLDWNLQAEADPETMRCFVAVSSGFYPELGAYYDAAIDEYLDKLLPEDEAEEEAA